MQQSASWCQAVDAGRGCIPRGGLHLHRGPHRHPTPRAPQQGTRGCRDHAVMLHAFQGRHKGICFHQAGGTGTVPRALRQQVSSRCFLEASPKDPETRGGGLEPLQKNSRLHHPFQPKATELQQTAPKRGPDSACGKPGAVSGHRCNAKFGPDWFHSSRSWEAENQMLRSLQ